MIFNETKLPGVFEILIEPKRDERGFFARTWCQQEFEQNGLNPKVVQCSFSFNERKGTLRGMHYQDQPHPECKLIRCTSGAIFDVVVDLRPDSPMYCQWIGVVLSESNRNMIYVPPGCGHGLLTIEDRSEIFYQMSEFFYPELSRGVRWNDPVFKIEWPAQPTVISDRDHNYPNFERIR